MSSNQSTHAGRRTFLKSAAAGMMILKPETVFGSQANSSVEVGIVGCGGRGNWIAPFFPEYTGARIVALADVISENLESTRTKWKVDSSRAYLGPEAYKELTHSKVDAVVIETPPYYHPEQTTEAVNAGKHVFVAKPIAVDVPGCKDFLAAGEKAKGKVSFLVDFQTRAMPAFQEAAARVHRGDIGDPVLGQVYYFAGRPATNRKKPGMHDEAARLLNFYGDKVLGGDIIVEQNIHVIDVANWYLQGHPLKAFGTGGRKVRNDPAYDVFDAYDHFIVTFWYPNNIKVDFSSNQLTNSFSDLCTRAIGIKGAVDSHYNGLVRITGENAWLGSERDNTFTGGAINNVKAFIDSIRTGKLLNNAATATESNLTCILGRTAAYQERVVTWDEMMKSSERLQLPKMRLKY
jgi:myo-inositol 2-dehydrogenase / D-chiro-inositol 1-dehydrogenase